MFYTTQELEVQGWTKSLIKKFLPEPCDIKKLSRFCVQHYYGAQRIAAIELTDEFVSLQQKALKKRESGLAAAKRKKLEYLSYLEYKMPVRVRIYPAEEVLERAIDSYNRRAMSRQYDYEDYDDCVWQPPAGTNSGKQFLDRITVNYIRHQLTSYDDLLKNQYGKIGKPESIDIIFKRIFVAISDNYPSYRDEAKRQLEARGIKFPESANYEFGEQMILFC